MNLQIQIKDYINSHVALKMKGYLRISFLFSIITFFWAAYSEAPKHANTNIWFNKEETQDIEKIYGKYCYIDGTLDKELKGERKGKGCGCTKSYKANKAINDAIDRHNDYNFLTIDYSYGMLMETKSGYGNFSRYKIIPSDNEMFFYSIKVGLLWAIVPFVIISFILPVCFAVIGFFFRNIVKGLTEILS